jgi:hypothetical protein
MADILEMEANVWDSLAGLTDAQTQDTRAAAKLEQETGRLTSIFINDGMTIQTKRYYHHSISMWYI